MCGPTGGMTTSLPRACPQSLYLTNVLLGTDRYQRLLKKSKAVVDHLPAYLQLALVLAIEAEAGTASFWAPYINCIRDQREPNGWAKVRCLESCGRG